jgi:hypothetical protein
MPTAASPRREVYTFCDVKYNKAKTTFYMPPTLSAANASDQGASLARDLFAMQTGRGVFEDDGTTPVVRCHGPYTTQNQPWETGVNSDGDYRSVEDKAVMVFGDANGGIHRFQIAGPEASIFYPDQETVDPTQAVVSQFIADVLNSTYNGFSPQTTVHAAFVGNSGIALTYWIGGYRRRAKQQRKLTIFTLDPMLTGPGE